MKYRILLLSALLIPATAFAANVTVWDFTETQNVQGWINQGLDTITETPQGLQISTQNEGQFRRDVEPGQYEALDIHYSSSAPVQMILLWQDPQTPDQATGIPLTLPPSPIPSTVSVNLKGVDGWNANTTKIGFQFGAGTTLVLSKITLTRWNMLEHAWYAFLSPWKFDAVRAYTINFVWGPLIAFTPAEIDQMFWNIPPRTFSVNWYLYGILALALIITIYASHSAGTHDKHRWWMRFFVLFFFLWIFYDIRMSAELASYVKTDYETFYTKSFAEQQYRDRGFFIQFIEAIRPVVEKEKSFVFLPFQGYPYMGESRYLLYPSNPLNPDAVQPDTTLWVVFNRPEVRMNETGQLTANGQVLSGTGAMVQEFAPGTFLFKTQ